MFMTKQEYRDLITQAVRETNGNPQEFFRYMSRYLMLKINEFSRSNLVTDDVTTRKDLVGRCANGELLALRFFWYIGPSLSICMLKDPYDVDVTAEEIYGHKDVVSTDIRTDMTPYDARVDESYKILIRYVNCLSGYNCPCRMKNPQIAHGCARALS